ncbi:hypothetical protein F441_06548 [Phytophthora nicotianae CJ01A1]|uniref:Uncharacterized protein n=5 Tax=Phytophthora nicotianae TaxID=4792 RepID=W2RBX4_PHYN3|nr:hypothetical protein PPTG_02645 [Phytophthora nicotianae INRA-310]ETI49767.1 hypothetical protein F443_06543 [Phytophthora nicotianae P1569]ETK89531.1 hypothetical protein L915_06412 [Phytophthora nicotianae]ETO78390.1 hypothetical protein F444_06609 [Phytophthora nicotianae P1976]ETP19404.1 hypothetical protein F441_06548 [Phytophthora nicotianae CJ01A1]KUF79994.1 hypothetical protein AM587_10017643 [Phytophthora nicotianae]
MEADDTAVYDATDAPTQAADVSVRPREFKAWPEDFDIEVYRTLKRGKERKAYLMSFGTKHGLQLPQTTTTPSTHQPRQSPKKNPGRKKTKVEKKLVPQNFAWPKGMNQREFLAQKPGKERMSYLARYIRKNGVELKETPARPRVPIGRQPEQRAHPRCGCFSSEACASCSRCMERHCVCGLTGRRHRALCLESRACNCNLADLAARCKLCHGCRQPHGFSHCRCVLHQRLLWIKRHPELGMELTEEEEEKVCKCFMLAHRHGGAAATKAKEAKALKETERVRRIKRAAGYPSSDNIYRSNKVATFLGDEGLESDLDDGVEDGPGSAVLPPSTDSVIPRTMTRRMLDPEYNPASYHPVFRSEGCSLLETTEPRGGRITRRENAAFISDAMRDEICRGLDNYAFELDRNAAMPSDDLVEFLVYMASIKSANVGELIGTFEDSAAVAASIVIEEYMGQLIEDTAVQQRALCPPTKASVQALTRELLVGFNWQLFEQQQPFSPTDPTDRFSSLKEKEATMKDTVATLVLREFVSTQPKSFDVYTDGGDVSNWIRNAVVIPSVVLTDPSGSRSSSGMVDITEDHSSGTSRSPNEVHQRDTAETTSTIPQIRLSVKANRMHGNPEYKLQFAATLEDGHHIETSAGGLDSKIKAKTMISRLSMALERQERRSKGTLEGPAEEPGPPPTPRPLPPQDPNDPYVSMFEHVWEHFNDCTRQKWEVSMDKYLRTKVPGWKGKASEQVAAMKRASTESPPRKQKKQKAFTQ